MPIKLTYKDLDLNIAKHPITGDLMTKSDDYAIKQSVKSIILTNIYERPFNPSIGTQINGLLFELDTFATRIMVENVIRNALAKFEPRIFVNSVIVNSDNSNGYNIIIAYKIKSYKKDDTISIFLNRIR